MVAFFSDIRYNMTNTDRAVFFERFEMKKFFARYSYDMVKMFLNQFAIAIFGFTLTLASGLAENPMLRNVTSIAAIAFYLFLLYTVAWDIGYKDKVSCDVGAGKHNPHMGALVSLCANLPNFLFAVFITLATFFNVEILSSIGGICSFLALTLEGMYTGLLTNSVAGVQLNSHWFIYFLLPLPAVLMSWVAYYLGLRDVKGTSFFRQVKPAKHISTANPHPHIDDDRESDEGSN